MNPQFNNKLLSGYQNFQQNNIPFQNNVLLQTNPMFMGNMQYSNSAQMQQMQQMQQLQMQQFQMQQHQMQKLKELQQIKHIEKMSAIETTMDKEKIRESVIKPIKMEKTKKDRQELDNKWREAEKNYIDSSGKDFGPEVKKYWKMRTNEPYKNILKNIDYSKKISSGGDLVVHRITNMDREGVQEDYQQMDTTREKHNNELKVIYSTDHKNEHKKKFEYNHVYKYRIQYDPKDHDKLKQDKIKYYKQQQKKEEDAKQQKDAILETLITDGIFDKDELNSVNMIESDKSDKYIKNSNDISPKDGEDKKKNKREEYLNRKGKK